MIYIGPHIFQVKEGKLNLLYLQCIEKEEMGPYRTSRQGFDFSEAVAESYRDSVFKTLNKVTKKIFNEGCYMRDDSMHRLHRLAEYYKFSDVIAWFQRYWKKTKDESFANRLLLDAKNRPNIEYKNRETIADFKNDILLSDIGQEMIDAKIIHLKRTNTNLSSHIKIMEARYTHMEDQDCDGWIIELSKDFDNYKKITGVYRSNKISIAYLQGEYSDEKTIVTDEMIALAKKVPFDKLLKLEIFGARKRCLCPFHNETNPSFYVYPDTNRGYCHACDKSVDTIQYIVDVKKMGFNQAVLMLLSY